jgi:glycosyltransferase involved in cell wall biosynthesis
LFLVFLYLTEAARVSDILKKTLLICGYYPLPENNGQNMRTMNFVHFFLKYGIVDIVYSNRFPDTKTGSHIFANEYSLDIRKHKSFKNQLIRGLMNNAPLPIYDIEKHSRHFLLTLIEQNNYDHIMVRYLHSARPLFDTKKEVKKRTIIDFDDILSGGLYTSAYGSVEGFFKRTVLRANKKLLENYENKCLTFGASLFCSEKDRLRMNGKNCRGKMFVVPNIYHNVLFEKYDFADGFHSCDTVLFVGTLNYRPNIDGLRWFVEAVFPEFKREYPDAKLLVVGRSPSPEIIKLCQSQDAIELHANPPDIRPYYSRCKAAVVPLLAGGGTRIKILEAALAGRPVISTPVGAEGLDLRANKEILLFETAHDFSAQFRKLYDREVYNALVKSAKSVVTTRYSKNRFDEVMGSVVTELSRGRNN